MQQRTQFRSHRRPARRRHKAAMINCEVIGSIRISGAYQGHRPIRHNGGTLNLIAVAGGIRFPDYLSDTCVEQVPISNVLPLRTR